MNVPDKNRTLEIMRELHIARATLHFSGGNDEGHADDPVFTMEPGFEQIAAPTSPYDYFEYGGWNQPNKLRDDAPLVVQLYYGLDAPIEEQYGSFAGEFYVDGDVIADAAAGTMVMEHDYETPSSEHLTTEF